MGMKSKAFWARRALMVFGAVWIVLIASGMLKDGASGAVVPEAAFWALVSTTVFIATRYYYASKGVACAMCKDTEPD
jgi:hypothetical protein